MHPKQKLGRGLSALIGEMDSFDQLKERENFTRQGEETEGEVFVHLPIKKLKPGPWQPRQNFNDSEIDKLSISIQENGLLQPILVTHSADKESYEIIAGERRWRASLRAKLEVIPCIVKTASEEKSQLIALIENVQREDLSSVEEAEGYQKMIDQFQYTQEKISETVGKSRSHVANMLRLLNLPKSIRSILQNSEISAGHARCLLGVSEKEALLLVDEVIQKKLNVRQLEKRVQKMRKGGGVVSKKTTVKSSGDSQDDLKKVAQDLEQLLKVSVSLDEKNGKGVLGLHFKTLEELDTLLEKLSS